MKKIIILDNNSDYKPLLEYYQKTKYKVIYLRKNIGHKALWQSKLYNKYKWNYFIYTDPDVLPIQECPLDFVFHFKKILSFNFYIVFFLTIIQ